MLTVDCPPNYVKGDRVSWDLHDRETLSNDGPYKPWYVGPEITFAEQREMFASESGPHPAGVFYTHTGAIRGLD